jgi:hypothetical protein
MYVAIPTETGWQFPSHSLINLVLGRMSKVSPVCHLKPPAVLCEPTAVHSHRREARVEDLPPKSVQTPGPSLS